MHVIYCTFIVRNNIKSYQVMNFFAPEISASFEKISSSFLAPDSRAASQALMAWRNRGAEWEPLEPSLGPLVTSCESHVTSYIFYCKHISFLQTRKPNNAVQCFYQRTAEPHQTCPTSACMPPNSKHTLRETECDCVQTKHTNEPVNN